MAEKLVGKASEFKDGDRRIVFVGDTEIGIFKDRGEFHAYSNYCLHQGGPACEGMIIAAVEERIMPDKTSKGLYFSDTETHFVCPWHGYEYDIKTGECASRRQRKAPPRPKAGRARARAVGRRRGAHAGRRRATRGRHPARARRRRPRRA